MDALVKEFKSKQSGSARTIDRVTTRLEFDLPSRLYVPLLLPAIIDSRRVDIRMAGHIGHGTNIHIAIQQVGNKASPQIVG